MERWRGALTLLGDDAARVRWRYAAFELDPSIPSQGVDLRASLEAKYGPGAAEVLGGRLAEVAEAEGLPMVALAEIKVRPNTFGAHRLLTAALEEGEAAQQALADALFAAYWARGEDVGDAEVLGAVSAAAGLSRDWAAANLAADANVAEVRAEERRAAERGIRAVPTFVFAERSALSGAQAPEALADAVRQALASSQAPGSAGADGQDRRRRGTPGS